ncbi:MAG: sensor histidine kinase [Lachnospiraceae bacterium]
MNIQLTITECENYIKIIVQDNGKGIEPTKIADLLDETKIGQQGGIGLKNVNRRLRLHYGIPLDIQTIPQKGTRILIQIPLSPNSEKK